ncbi:very short patch repair endonuclease [Methylogaea oryzae]|uniref:very short patch repair endonuclease n=1 Tax=Methylogaea oryzae TaxID=1295382 RepID=UPI0009EB060F|nr:DNA mismatch endonuclease Vsr [Methylogaea oryzae]
MDVLTPEQRSVLMSRIRGKDTKPELVVRRLAHALGFRYRLHRRDLPGSPDLVFPRLRKVILVHGCFWHRHPGCRFAYSPKSNTAFWEAKFAANVKRDHLTQKSLEEQGWDCLIIWECEIKDIVELSRRLQRFLAGQD